MPHFEPRHRLDDEGLGQALAAEAPAGHAFAEVHPVAFHARLFVLAFGMRPIRFFKFWQKLTNVAEVKHLVLSKFWQFPLPRSAGHGTLGGGLEREPPHRRRRRRVGGLPRARERAAPRALETRGVGG